MCPSLNFIVNNPLEMRKIILSICVSIHLIFPALAQDINIGLSAGFAFPMMEFAKSQLKYTQKSLPFDAKITDNFPAWFEYKTDVYADYHDFMFGFYILQSATGGRVSSKDFSANYAFDVNMQLIAFGPNVKLLLKEINKTRVFLCISGGPELLRTDVLEEFELYANNQKISYLNVRDKQQGYHAILGFTGEIRFSRRVSASIYTNYYFSSYRFPKETRTVYFSFNNRIFYIFPKWNGIRSGLSVFLTIPEKVD